MVWCVGAEMIGGRDLLAQIENESPKLGIFLRQFLIPAIETTAQNAGVSATGKIAAPAPPEAVNVTSTGEFLQVTVNHAAPIQKGIQYITHISTNPTFTAPIIYDHGSSRCPPPVQLPTKDADGNTIDYYVRTAAQYPGSDPSAWTYHGGNASAPVAVNLGGTTQMTLQTGTGSGTGSSDGQQSAVGLGRTIFRPAPGPKRAVGQ